MKNLMNIVLVVLLATSLSSCKKIKSIFDVEIETTLTGDLYIDVQESGLKSADADSISFISTITIDPLDDDDVNEYQEKIVEVAVDGILATVEEVYLDDGTQDDVIFYRGTTIRVERGSSSGTWTFGTDWNVMVGDEITLEDAGDIYDAVSEMLSPPMGEITVICKGKCSKSGVHVVLRIDFETTYTANPL